MKEAIRMKKLEERDEIDKQVNQGYLTIGSPKSRLFQTNILDEVGSPALDDISKQTKFQIISTPNRYFKLQGLSIANNSLAHNFVDQDSHLKSRIFLLLLV